MLRFIARVFAFILSVSVFVIAAVLVFQLRPESATGWGVLVGAGLLALISPFLTYYLVMRRFHSPDLPNEGEGAGLAMGAGIDSARRRNDDVDELDLDFD